jgi:hypothetical protein
VPFDGRTELAAGEPASAELCCLGHGTTINPGHGSAVSMYVLLQGGCLPV